MLQTKYLITLMGCFYNGFGAFAMSVGYEQLSKFFLVDHFDDFTHTRFVEFVEDVVKE